MAIRKSFKHWLGDKLPQPISEERLTEIWPRLRAGEKEIQDEVVLGHLRLACSKVAEMVRFHDTDEMVSIAFQALVDGVHAIGEGKIDHHTGIPNVTGYLVKKISGRLLNFSSKQYDLPLGNWERRSAVTTDYHDDGSYDSLAQDVESVVKSPSEMEVIHLLVKGYRPTEIANILGKHKQYVSNTVTDIRKRLRAKYDREQPNE